MPVSDAHSHGVTDAVTHTNVDANSQPDSLAIAERDDKFANGVGHADLNADSVAIADDCPDADRNGFADANSDAESDAVSHACGHVDPSALPELRSGQDGESH